jgi:hypothetical protein
MKQKPRFLLLKCKHPKTHLRLPDLDYSKTAELNSLTSLHGRRGYGHAIDEFVDWYCSEPRLTLNRTVVLRYRTYLEARQLAPGTINLRLGAVRRLAYEAADYSRLVALADGNVTFRWRDSAHCNKKRLMTLSSCAASCSISFRQASCASATSGSSPTATALRCCRCARNCSADHRKTQPRRHQRPPIRPTPSGTARSAAEPCTSSNGSPPPNSCSARRLNQTGAQHETLSTSSALAPASARSQVTCLICPGLLARLSLQPSADTSSRVSPHHRTVKAAHPTQLSRCLIPPPPLKPIQSA